MSKLNKVAVRHAKALGRAEAALAFIAAAGDPELARQTARDAIAEINRITAGEDKEPK